MTQQPLRIVACQNFKGGTAKTTTVISLAHCLVRRGKRVLIIDLDAQGSVGVSLGVEAEYGLYDLLIENRPLIDCLVEARPNLFCLLAVPLSARLARNQFKSKKIIFVGLNQLPLFARKPFLL